MKTISSGYNCFSRLRVNKHQNMAKTKLSMVVVVIAGMTQLLMLIFGYVVIATEEEVQGHWCERMGEDEITRERTICLPHFQVC